MDHFGSLPPLAFGQRQSVRFRNAEHLSEAAGRDTPTVMNYRSSETDGSFLAQFAVIKTAKIRLTAASSSSFRVEARGSPTGLLMVPLHGFTITQRKGRTIEWGQGKCALYLPPGGCSARSTGRSAVGVDIEPTVLNGVAQTMLGGKIPKRGAAFDFATACPIALQSNHLDFGSIFQDAISTLDRFDGRTDLIEKSGVDDLILRIVALLFNIEEMSEGNADTGGRSAVLRLACEYIDANLTRAITLTDLESLTGLSRRSLQYAFRSTFDCTPMQWVAQRRLETVRSQILAARQGTNLTRIAGEYFANLGEFARLYRQRYGELPSMTLKNVLAKRLRS